MQPYECIVVDDGSDDDPAAITRDFRCHLVSTGARYGPAYARNIGASLCNGNVLLFVDADVCVYPDTLERIARRFSADPRLATLIGAYDSSPGHRSFLSQYRNLLHSFTHRTANESASTFWAACGAVRAHVFRQFGGFRTEYRTPSIEDIELGYRLAAGGCRMVLDRTLLVTHWKQWRFWDMISTDIFRRAAPWAELILARRRFPDDLNIKRRQRASLWLVWFSAALAMLSFTAAPLAARALAMAALLGSVSLDFGFYRFLTRCRGPWFTLSSVPLYTLFHICSGLGFLIGAARWAVRRTPATSLGILAPVNASVEELPIAVGRAAE